MEPEIHRIKFQEVDGALGESIKMLLCYNSFSSRLVKKAFVSGLPFMPCLASHAAGVLAAPVA